MKKTYGYKTIISFLYALVWIYIISESWIAVFWALGFILMLAVAFVPLYTFRQGTLGIHYLNPLRKSYTINYTDINKVSVHVGDYLFRVELYLNNGTKITTKLAPQFNQDAKGIYNEFLNRNIPITSTGVMTIEWPV